MLSTKATNHAYEIRMDLDMKCKTICQHGQQLVLHLQVAMLGDALLSLPLLFKNN